MASVSELLLPRGELQLQEAELCVCAHGYGNAGPAPLDQAIVTPGLGFWVYLGSLNSLQVYGNSAGVSWGWDEWGWSWRWLSKMKDLALLTIYSIRLGCKLCTEIQGWLWRLLLEQKPGLAVIEKLSGKKVQLRHPLCVTVSQPPLHSPAETSHAGWGRIKLFNRLASLCFPCRLWEYLVINNR